MHDRFLYTNYSIAESGVGFNLYQNKPNNSAVTGKSIFDYHTYTRLKNHFSLIKEEIEGLKKLETIYYKTNSNEAFDCLLSFVSRV